MNAAQRRALDAFVSAANQLSKSLAADDLHDYQEHLPDIASVMPTLQKEFATPHPLSRLIQRLAALECLPVGSLAETRNQFLPFSTTTVELAKQARKEDPAFASLKVDHCPMAPKPGLWIQAKGPLANPFFGAEMLRCGSEVKP